MYKKLLLVLIALVLIACNINSGMLVDYKKKISDVASSAYNTVSYFANWSSPTTLGFTPKDVAAMVGMAVVAHQAYKGVSYIKGVVGCVHAAMKSSDNYMLFAKDTERPSISILVNGIKIEIVKASIEDLNKSFGALVITESSAKMLSSCLSDNLDIKNGASNNYMPGSVNIFNTKDKIAKLSPNLIYVIDADCNDKVQNAASSLIIQSILKGAFDYVVSNNLESFGMSAVGVGGFSCDKEEMASLVLKEIVEKASKFSHNKALKEIVIFVPDDRTFYAYLSVFYGNFKSRYKSLW